MATSDYFLTTILSELNLDADYEPSDDSAGFLFVCVRDQSKNELSRFKIEKSFLVSRSLTDDQREKLKTLFYNNIWPIKDSVLKGKDVGDFIDSNYPPNTPLEKQERVLDYIRSLSTYDGEGVDYKFPDMDQLWRKAYVKNEDEFRFYFDSLEDGGLLKVLEKFPGLYQGITLTVSGLNKLVTLDEKKRSKTCFVAMSFSEELKPIYEQAIAAAIRETGFEPLKIDDNAAITSEQTINDAILAAIKKSQFTIADFTKQRAGVYFEAGYALGRGHKVIYTCREDDIDNAHFDTRNYPHILWKGADDLKKQLIDKIEVYIKG